MATGGSRLAQSPEPAARVRIARYARRVFERERGLAWEPPADGRRVRVIESHAAGEPLRVVLDGLPAIPGDTIVAKRSYARERLDGGRRGLRFEPRGHADMYG